MADRIAEVEQFYARYGVPARFQLCPDCPPALDSELAGRGYARQCPMSLQTTTAEQVAARLRPPAPRLCVDDGPTTRWFDVWRAVHAPDADPDPEWRLLARVGRPTAYVSVLERGEAVAVGRVVTERGWSGVFGMATLPRARGRGAATAVLAAMAHWAREQAAPRMYLQIEAGNVPALRLYASAGFVELFGYHYRTAHSSI